MKICKITISTLLAIAMTLTMMPLNWGAGSYVYAEAKTADGGVVASNSPENAQAAFGSDNVTAEYAGQKLTITLLEDIELSAPVLFQKGTSGDTIILDLNGKSITCASAENGSDADKSKGKNAIDICPADYNIEITDNSPGATRGSIIGGDGGVYETSSHFKYGRDGGMAVCFVNSEWSPEGAGELAYGLRVTGGVSLTGGNGGKVTDEDWLYNLGEYTGARDMFQTLYLEAGCGGAGIGQSAVDGTLVYTRIDIVNGEVTGGEGGNIDISGITPTFYALLTTDAVAAAMGNLDNYYFSDRVLTMKTFSIGAGGDGIEVGYGRKYINVEAKGIVKGSACGSIIYGDGKYINSYNHNNGDLHKVVSRGENNISDRAGAAGDGIAVRGSDIGKTNTTEVGFSGDGWQDKNQNSDDMGIYVAGKVSGGSAPDAEGLHEGACDGGAGIGMYGDVTFTGYTFPVGESLRQWGIVCVDEGGVVTGGNGGSSVTTGGGVGGPGILDDYSKDSEDVGTDYYIVNGSVLGGNGGSSSSHYFGDAGWGVEVRDHYREDMYVAGNGSVKAGNAGNTVAREGNSIENSEQEGIYCYSSRTNYFTVSTQNGGGATALPVNTIDVTASMTDFSGYPTVASPVLSCEYNKPNGYTGGAYIQWFARLKLQSNPAETYVIEPTQAKADSLHFLDNNSYKYNHYSSGNSIHYHLDDIVTIERIIDIIENNNSTATIFCTVLLEDGSWGVSNEITFTKDGYSSGSGSGGGQSQEEIDREAADNVLDMLIDLPGLGSLTLEDADAVAAVRAAYEALTPSQQALLESYTFLQDLEAAEAKIAQLQGAEDTAEAEKVENLITALTNPEQITLEDEAAVIAAREAYDNLTDAQKAKVSQDALDKLEAAEGKIDQLNQAAADAVTALIAQIQNLADLDPEDPEYDTKLQAAKESIEHAAAAYNDLSPSQKALIDSDVENSLHDAVKQYNDAFPNTPIDDPTIEPVSITAGMITVANATYTGGTLTPQVTVKDGSKVLKEGTDYTKAYGNNVNAGKGKVTVTGKGDYKDTATKEFTISPKAVTPSVILSPVRYVWNGKVKTPAVTVKNGGASMAASQYSVSYAAGRKNVGTYATTAALHGNFSGSNSATFTIVPKGATIVKPVAAKKAITVKWKKQAAKMSKSRITGYQVQCSTNKKFKSGVKKKTVKGYKKTAVKISRLKSKKTYYVRVRTYMKTGGKTYYSNWSKVKAVKVK